MIGAVDLAFWSCFSRAEFIFPIVLFMCFWPSVNILSLGRAPVVEGGGVTVYHRYALSHPLFLLLYVWPRTVCDHCLYFLPSSLSLLCDRSWSTWPLYNMRAMWRNREWRDVLSWINIVPNGTGTRLPSKFTTTGDPGKRILASFVRSRSCRMSIATSVQLCKIITSKQFKQWTVANVNGEDNLARR